MSAARGHVEVAGMTRGALLLRGALAAGAAAGTAAVAPFVTRALAQDSRGDVETLNFALTLEYLEVELYEQAAALGLSRELADVARAFGDQEAEHQSALIAAIRQLGGRPAARPRFTFPMTDEKSFLAIAQAVEDTGLYAYNGAILAVESGEVLAAAAAIAQVEARHAATLRLARGLEPAPRSFDKSLTPRQARDAVRPLFSS